MRVRYWSSDVCSSVLAMEALVAERRARGDFASLDDFAGRIDPKQLNRRQIEALAGAGAFDGVEPERPRAYAGAEALLACANSSAHERSTGQRSEEHTSELQSLMRISYAAFCLK